MNKRLFSLLGLLGATVVIAGVTSVPARGEFNVDDLNQQVQAHEQKLTNHEARITNTESDVKVVQESTGTAPAPERVAVQTVQPAQAVVQPPAPTPLPVTRTSSTERTIVTGDHAEYWCDDTYSDGTSKSRLVSTADNSEGTKLSPRNYCS